MRTVPTFTRHPILFEDSTLMAIHKPEGVLSHPNPGGARARCAFEGRYLLEERRYDTPAGPLWLVHRLDQDTSGVLLAAKSEDAAESCRELFERQEVEKTYMALVIGRVSPNTGIWSDCLQKRTGPNQVRTEVVKGPPNARLKYEVVESFHPGGPGSAARGSPRPWGISPEHTAYIRIQLLTGRTHQIRVQTASRHHAVAGDRLYGDFPANKALRASVGLGRLFLHASRLGLRHPKGGASLGIEAPLTAELEGVLGQLREGGKNRQKKL